MLKDGHKKIDYKQHVQDCRAKESELASKLSAKGAFNKASWLNVDDHKAEVKELVSMFNELQFSDKYQRWGKNSRAKLIKVLGSDPEFPKNQQDWSKLSLEDKQDKLRAFAKIMQREFSHDKALFTPRKVCFNFYSQSWNQSAGGYFERASAHVRPYDWMCTIRMNVHKDAGFESFDTVMNSVFHETLHSMHFSFADLHSRKLVHDKHALKDDMEMLSYSRMIGVGSSLRVVPLYYATPIERDSHAQSKAFMREWQMAFHSNDNRGPNGQPLKRLPS